MILRRASNDARMRLGAEIGRGGEGRVFSLQGVPGLVAKIYNKPPSAGKAEKLRAMVRNPAPATFKFAAWPTDVVLDEHCAVRGFLMPKLSCQEDLHELYNPKSRMEVFPAADFRFIVRAATNLARAFAFLHAQGHVIGDVNHGNAVVADDATVVLIDCDSFQIRHRVTTYVCDVGVSLFTPTELQGRSFRGLRRSENHDAFGLAVLIFHLLFQGRHPFAGRFAHGEMSIERAIAERRFAYSRNSDKTQMSPPPATLPLGVFGAQIEELFHRSFETCSSERPRAPEWIARLSELEESLVTCAANAAHFRPKTSECCWCELEARFGLRLFRAQDSQLSQDLGSNVEHLWHQIMQVPHPGAAPKPPAKPSALASKLHTAKVGRWLRIAVNKLSIIGAVISFIVFIDAAADRQLAYLALVFFCFISAGTWIGRRDRARKRAAANRAAATLARLQARWYEECSSEVFDSALAELRDAKAEIVALAQKRAQKLASLADHHTRSARQEFLRRYRIDQIPSGNLTRSQRARLHAFGIFTAADVDRKHMDIQYLLSERATEELLAWYRMHLRSFEPSVNPPDPAKVAAIETRFDQLQERLVRKLVAGPQILRDRRHQISQARLKFRGPLQKAIDELSRTRGAL